MGFINWPFMSVHSWGENPYGQWKLQVVDKVNCQVRDKVRSLFIISIWIGEQERNYFDGPSRERHSDPSRHFSHARIQKRFESVRQLIQHVSGAGITAGTFYFYSVDLRAGISAGSWQTPKDASRSWRVTFQKSRSDLERPGGTETFSLNSRRCQLPFSFEIEIYLIVLIDLFIDNNKGDKPHLSTCLLRGRDVE